MFFDKPKLSEPNEMGFQFGINESLTEYAHKEQLNWGNTLPSVDITVLEVWKDDNHISNLLMDEKTNSPLQECYGFEATACAIDKYKFVKSLGQDDR